MLVRRSIGPEMPNALAELRHLPKRAKENVTDGGLVQRTRIRPRSRWAFPRCSTVWSRRPLRLRSVVVPQDLPYGDDAHDDQHVLRFFVGAPTQAGSVAGLETSPLGRS
jgi:hypothetical protein